MSYSRDGILREQHSCHHSDRAHNDLNLVVFAVIGDGIGDVMMLVALAIPGFMRFQCLIGDEDVGWFSVTIDAFFDEFLAIKNPLWRG